MLDVLVAGGGPAGAVTGLCLARAGVRVAVVEATSYDGPRFGETLPPEVNPLLAELAILAPFRALEPAQASGIVSAWGSATPAEQDFVANPHGSGWRVDRNAFDAMLLWEAVSAGATVLFDRKAIKPVRSGGVWSMDEIRARVLVDATGRTGLIFPNGNDREIDDVLVAIAAVVSYPDAPSQDSRTYIEACPSGWWYSGLLPDGDGIAMFFTDPETYNAEGIVLGEQLSRAPLTCGRLGGARMKTSRVVHAPSSCRRTMVGDGWLTVGDSASAYDPLSGRGVFKALRQGAMAARAVLASLDGDRSAAAEYASTVRQEYDAYVSQRRKFYDMERRWETSGFWARRRKAAAFSA